MNTMKKRLGLEAIAFQSNHKGKQIELLINQLRAKTYNAKQAQNSSEIKALQKSIHDLFGLKAKLIVDTDILAAIELSVIKSNHIFFDQEVRHWFKDDLNKVKKKVKSHVDSSTVDLKNAYISGIFSTIELPVYLSWNSLINNSNYSDAEITAILLHELGHGFTTFEYYSRFVATNQALAIVANTLLHKENTKEYQYVLKEVGKEFLNDETRFSDLVEVKDTKVVIPYIFSTIIKETKSEMGTLYYDRVACEFLADNFVARLQYGKEIVSGLDKLHPGFMPEKSPWMQIVFDLSGLLMAFSITVVVTGGLNIFALVLSIFWAWSFMEGGKIQNYDFTYDRLKIRYTRVKEQMIQDLKRDKFDPATIAQKIKDIDAVNEIVKQTYITNSWNIRLMKFLLPGQRKAHAALQMQRDLEELTANDLFVKSAQLKVLAS
jgi:hypothetical protein